MTAPEFSLMIDPRLLPAAAVTLTPDAAQRAALARRFGLVAIEAMSATASLEPDGAGVRAQGRLAARVVQPCAVSGEDITVAIDEPVELLFVPAHLAAAPSGPDAEVEIDTDDEDEIAYEGDRFDLGEAIAQSLGLAIDWFATGPDADRVRREHGLEGEGASGPFAALAALKKST